MRLPHLHKWSRIPLYYISPLADILLKTFRQRILELNALEDVVFLHVIRKGISAGFRKGIYIDKR
jgi:hypothetical protein